MPNNTYTTIETESGKPDIVAVDKKVDTLLNIMIGVVVVLGVGFMTLLVMVAQMTIDTYHDKQTDYQRLTDQVQAQNAVLNEIEKKINK